MLLGVLVLAAAIAALIVSRGDGRDGDPGDVALDTPAWDAVVLVDPATGRVVVTGPDGVELAAGSASTEGALDVGVAGRVVLGSEGDPAVDGLGVLDLSTGMVDVLRVDHGRVVLVGDGPVLIATDGERATSALQIVDVIRRRVSELTTFAGPDAIVPADGIVAAPAGGSVAFTDLSTASTVLLDLTTGRTATVPGRVADLTDERVATITNRGDTVLVDLSDLSGTRLGTVETSPLAGLLVTGLDEAVAVTTTGVVGRLRFGAGEFAETARLGTDGIDVTVVDTAIVAARQRLAVTTAGSLVLVGADGTTADTVSSSISRPLLDGTRPGVRCVHLVGTTVEPSLLVDVTDGRRLATVEPGTVVRRSTDGCVLAMQRLGSTVVNVVGDDIDLDVGDPVLALAPDGSAMVIGGTRPRLVMLDDVTEIRLPRSASAAVFAQRADDPTVVPPTTP